ncbi:MAG: intein-containing RctB family protein [Candidatus Altiarchaeales archaeon]|nr:intein-containing RctB family protein [Candidatus Altiarchaeota archaeon]MBU4341321.1 intein-containing RctB family protein [Candidatus Altiarchaeota archaeon]MBU4437859.1 intein-containing RctB family protein [Candidatus Altiarchaeota archaeon]MCG2782995.1 intein-containing RctB family protein [Candidatus Altiarchaeales archaeon]
MDAKQIRDGVWEFIQEGVPVPVRIYANEKIFKGIEEGVLKQSSNVARLPGIQKASLVMPDAHYGYGFPIGGVAAFDPDEGGIVSPGGVGYDINCLSGDSRILHEHGYFREIKGFEKDFEKERIKCMNFGKKVKNTDIDLFLKSKSKADIYKIKTVGGEEIIATGDHPFYTPEGMVPLNEVEGKVAGYPFKGVPYEKPKDEVIISKEDMLKLPLEKNKTQTIKELEQRGLLPLRRSNDKLPHLLKLMGFILGDGCMYFTENKGSIWFYGKAEDLEDIRDDIERIGFRASKVYSRTRKHKITTEYDDFEFSRTEYSIKTTASSLAALLIALGTPRGKKVEVEYRVPNWIFACPLWQKRLFLASLFGAELSSPSTVTNHGYNFYGPVLSMNKKRSSLKSGRIFMNELCSLLADFGIKSSMMGEREAVINKKGDKSQRLRMQISSKPENLVKFFSKIGFEYNREKRYLANVAIHYLKLKDNVVKERIIKENKALELKKEGMGLSNICKELESPYVNKRFIERSLYQGRKNSPRVAYNFPTFAEFLRTYTRGLGNTGMVWDEIIDKKKLPYDDYVYDFTVNDKHHNFIANNFVVSNCGVRLLSTNLTEQDVRPKLKQLVDNLFSSVPSGVGSKSKVRLSESELDEVLSTGAGYAVKKGFGTEEDLDHMEENGCMEGADPSKVGHRAKQRGRPQMGTLGSGNHFLEVQKVDKIFEPEIASRFGIHEEGQITAMVHCGSRGFGHQVADDYIHVMMSAAKKYGIELPDRELACAPLTSKEAKDYLAAMKCAVNYAFCNRQFITHWVRKTFGKIFPDSDLELIYDVCHNIAKFEKHDGKELCVHRKGATRAFAAGRKEIPHEYRDIGQPVIIPGDMGTASYILVGTEKAMEETFGSTCHGAGRTMSRSAATRKFRGEDVKRMLEEKGEVIRATNWKVLAEEVPEAYKDVDEVIRSVELSGISKAIARVVPLGVAKG